ncbi:MAG: hypothetical protein WCF28_03000 [Methanobacterium sp.]|uniref:hypothetical protein n=1 Tax=Methanobacterium sp. TaxID=2164 RepID=UPI003C72547A
MSSTEHFEIGIDDQRGNITIYSLEYAKISLIGYTDLANLKWNDSFEKLAEYLENEVNWGL